MSIIYTEEDEIELLELLEEQKYQESTGGYLTKFFTTPEERAKYPHWMTFFEASKDNRQIMALCANQVGKALKNSELLFTHNGTVEIGSISVGDKIFGPDGKLTTVTGVFPQGIRLLFKFTFEDETYVFADIDHLWDVQQSSSRSRGYSKHGQKQILSTRELLEAYSKNVRYSIPQTQPVCFQENKVCKADRYIIGALLGDGSICSNAFGISSADQEIIQRFAEYSLRHNRNSYDYAIRVKFSEKARYLKNELVRLKLWNTHSHEKFIPQELLFDSIDNRKELLRGLLDTDGFVDSNGKVEFSSCSKQLSEGVAFLARSLGYRCSIKESKPKVYTYKGIKKIGRTAHTVRIVGENRSDLFYLPRKKFRCHEKNRSNRKLIEKIEIAEQDYATCITVDNDSRTFLTTDFNVTHNTTSGLFAVAVHSTGRYPDWWPGFRFDGPNDWWIGGVSQTEVRDTLQSRLLGPVGDFGTGAIPIDAIDFETLKDARRNDTPISTFRVRHVNGGYSNITFKSYEQGREAWQAKPGISILLDEEPPLPIYTEALMRTIAGNGRVMLTFTPLKGVSDTVMNFLGDCDILHPTGQVAPGRFLVRASWADAPHLSEEAKEQLLHSIPKFQRDARTKGIPTLGAGAIYQVPETMVFIDPFPIPKHWPRSYAMDVGWNRTAAVWGAIDPDSGIHYIYSEHYLGEETPVTHTAAIQARGKWIPGAIDPAARGRGQDDGQKLFDQYTDLGLNLEKANNAVTGPLWEISEAMEQGRFKIFNTCTNILNEYRLYRRDEKGKIVKKDDHAMDAIRYWWNTGRSIAITEKAVNTNFDMLPSVRPRF